METPSDDRWPTVPGGTPPVPPTWAPQGPPEATGAPVTPAPPGASVPPSPPLAPPVHGHAGGPMPPGPPAADPFDDPGPWADQPAPARRSNRGLLGALALVALLIIGSVGFVIGRRADDSPADRSSAVTPVSSGPVSTAPPPLSGTEVEPAQAVAASLGPAVVQIETGGGLGSGFVYDGSGLIMTAAHVVDGTSRVQVRLADGRRLPGRVLGADDSTDVAVVKLDGEVADLPLAVLATGVKVEVGQTAIAIGSPFGLDQTVTAGIVSAVGRSVETPGGTVPMVQTDAPINPGNSGGALADRRGRVIGINDSIAGRSGGNVGVGFAIPIDIAKSVADRIVTGRSLAAGYLGVTTTEVIGARSGAQISDVSPGSPAASAGLRPDDVVVAVDDARVDSNIDLQARIRSHEPGQEVRIRFLRGDEEREVVVQLGEAPG